MLVPTQSYCKVQSNISGGRRNPSADNPARRADGSVPWTNGRGPFCKFYRGLCPGRPEGFCRRKPARLLCGCRAPRSLKFSATDSVLPLNNLDLMFRFLQLRCT